MTSPANTRINPSGRNTRSRGRVGPKNEDSSIGAGTTMSRAKEQGRLCRGSDEDRSGQRMRTASSGPGRGRLRRAVCGDDFVTAVYQDCRLHRGTVCQDGSSRPCRYTHIFVMPGIKHRRTVHLCPRSACLRSARSAGVNLGMISKLIFC